ncbi:MAG: preprotein translocase subunit SecY [Oscillospiraceae bacterium]|nr:preprotein translocase subunit SecY [Oscillospiraceae bacterium]MDD4367763.1 preprotein translocase subunit SecY [Oscillospiraceae bacterium]
MGSMFDTLKNAWRVPELRKKLLFTIAMIAVFRVGGNIPVPGIDKVAFTNLLSNFGQLGSLMDIMSGGALAAVSIFAMGITPYINSSIIIQLLTVAIPALERMSKEGETGRKQIQQIVRIVTVALALLTSFAFWFNTRTANTSVLPTWLNALVVIGSFTAGTAIIMWIGELINVHGIGNGISIIIFAGILARIPSMLGNLVTLSEQWAVANVFLSIFRVLLVVILTVAAIIAVLYVQLAERRIPIQYAKRMVGRKMYGGQSTYLPIKVNQSGVIPVIFAVSILQIPNLIVTFFFSNSTNVVARWFSDFGTSPFYYVLDALLIFGFTFFYSMIQFNPIEVSNNIQKNGGYIPGVRPGRPTSEFIARTSQRLTWFDGLFLVVVSLAPMLIGTLTGTQNTGIWFGGTAIIIIVGVCLDLINQLEAQMSMRNYKGFLD